MIRQGSGVIERMMNITGSVTVYKECSMGVIPSVRSLCKLCTHILQQVLHLVLPSSIQHKTPQTLPSVALSQAYWWEYSLGLICLAIGIGKT